MCFITNYDTLINLQDPGEDYLMELAFDGTVEFSDNCVTTKMELWTATTFKLYGNGLVNDGTISIFNTQSLLIIKGVDTWELTVDGTSMNYTQSEFHLFPESCP